MCSQNRRRGSSSPNGNRKAPTQQRQDSSLRSLRPIIAAVAVLGAISALAWTSLLWYSDNAIGVSHYGSPIVDWDFRREEVKNAFVTSWDAYKRHAWGKDRYHPVSGEGSQMSPKGLGWITVDSLDTMMIMNLSEPLAESRQWLQDSLTYDQDQEVNTFETTIRMLGGLLSAHYLAGKLPGVSSKSDSVYLEKAIDLGDRLLPAYKSQAGIPYSGVNIGSKISGLSHDDSGASTMAEAGTLQLEMKYLSYLTGNDEYWRRAEHVIKILDDIEMDDGLLPIFVHPDLAGFMTLEIRLGSRGDSYYEYLIKQYLQTSGQEPIYLEMWEQALAGIQKHLVTTTKHSNMKIIAELPYGIGGGLIPKMDHLVCFLPGAIALGATMGLTLAEARKSPKWSAEKEQQMELAKDIMKACWGMYAVTETGLAPEITWFDVADEQLKPEPGNRPQPPTKDSLKAWKDDFIIKTPDAHNLQRPETVESLFIMWRITNEPL